MKKLLPFGLALAAALTGTQAHAASATWNSTGTDGNWFTAGNWTPGASPGSAGTGTITNADTATFNSASNNTTVAINGTALNIKGITFDTNAAAYTIGASGANAGNSILLTSAGTIQITSGFLGTGAETINAPLTLEGNYTIQNNDVTTSAVLDIAGNITGAATGTLTLGNGGTAGNAGANTISGAISNSSGTLSLTMNGASSQWILSGNNTYSGLTGVTRGTLVLSGNNSGASGGVTVNNGATLDINNANALGTGTLLLNNGNSFDNTSGGAITNAGNNAITVSNGFTFTGSNSLNMGTGTLSYTAAVNQGNTWSVNSNTLTIGGRITGVGNITKAGAGSLALAGNNSGFTGNLALGSGNASVSGALDINNANALGTGTFTINAGSGGIATIDNTSSGAIVNAGNNVQVWDTSFTYAGTQALNLGTGSVTFGTSGTSSITLTTTANNLTVGGIISGFSASDQLIKAGAGTLTLTGASTYTGTTTVTGGVLALGNTSALAGAITLNGGNLDLATDTAVSTSNTVNVLTNSTVLSDRATAGSGLTQTLGALNIGGFTLTTTAGANATSGTPVVAFGATTLSGTVAQTTTFNPTTAAITLASVGSNANTGVTDTLVLAGTATGNSVTGVISNNSTHGVTAVTKSNSSTWTLGGVNTYTAGTTVSGGNLVLTGSTSSSGTFTVGGVSGGLGTATLSGTGTLSGLLVTSSANSNVAHIAPGATAGTVGTLHVGSLGFTVGAGTQFDFDINTTVANSDLITMTGGTLTIGGAGIDFNFNQLSSLTAGTAYTLISGATSVSGFSASDFTATGDTGYTATFTNTGTAITVTFTASVGGSPNYYFTGTNSGSFTDAGNYFTAATGGSQQATALSSTSNVFLNANTASNTPDTLNASASINSLNFVTAGTSLAGSGTVTLAATGTAGITDGAGVAGQTETVAPAVVLGSNQSWVATANSTLNVTGAISGPQSLALTGNGTYKLGGSNTFQGLTVGTGSDAPTLYLTNGTSGSATGTTTLRVNAGATLAGNGTSSGTSFNVSGTSTSARANVLVGLTSATDATVGNVLTLKGSTGTSTIADANLTFNLDAKSTASNQLSVGATNIAFGTDATGSVKFTLNLENEPAIVANGTTYTLIAGTGSTSTTIGASTGQYTGLTLGATTTVGGVTETIITGGNLQLAFGSSIDNTYYGSGSYLVLYQNATGNIDDIDVVVVPEPGTWALMLGGLALLVVVQRARRKNG
jgi:fibronectin-binding autotransporter adhesin